MKTHAYLKIIVSFFLVLAAMLPSEALAGAASSKKDDELQLQSTLNKLYQVRATAVITQNPALLDQYYVMDKSGQAALRHERNRIAYLNAWADKRSVKLTRSQSSIRIIRQSYVGDYARVSLVQSHRIGYIYTDRILPEQNFGVGTRHAVTLVKSDGVWKIFREWYLDPLDEDTKLISDKPDTMRLMPHQKEGAKSSSNHYNREGAVQYANKYAGAAWGAGNGYHYNKRYLDYTGKGGDCTNFASQVIGDSEGGGLPIKEGWRYFPQAGGTQTWVQTDAFRNFLLRSGYAELIAKGSYSQIAAPSEKYPHSPLSALSPGDLIGYILHGDDTDHFSVVVGFDDSGYPLVNSHTADRYRVPFDLGWDSNTKYQLFHIRD